jgi:hypothetical protein
MASTCLWRSWETRLDWTAYATVPPDVRDRLAAFLAPVCAVIADLAATCPDATDDDLIAVLGTHVLSRPGPGRTRPVAALAGVVGDRLAAAPDGPDADPAAEDRRRAWRFAITRALTGKTLAVQWAIVAVLFDRVLRARLTGPEADDRDKLEHAAAGLTAALGAVLQAVGSRAIPPEAYHVM